MRKLITAALLLATAPLLAQTPLDPMANDQVANYDWVRPQADYVRRVEMVPDRKSVV